MTLLLDPARLAERRQAAAGPLSSLADSLASDLDVVMERDLFIPSEKAALSRSGGRCARDGALLTFDPWSPRVHTCPLCGESYSSEEHYRWWIMSYQLWLAERAVHAATLHALRGEVRHAACAERILEGYVERYLAYPNRDNVLGPTRLFFSTYLESIWLLQIAVALDLLEATGRARALGGRVRDGIIAPSASIIESYDEGASNRQVWNNSALLAAQAMLGQLEDGHSPVDGPSGLVSHLEHGLLVDGTWYEGENYHLFAHRGLWYGVQIAEQLGIPLPQRVVARFDEGFAASFASVLPDLTLPSRRDSQYAISTRQWRFAELCELGLVRGDDPRIRSVLGRLYACDIPHGNTGRAASSAEVERNLAPSALTRADLGWRSLLLAHPDVGELRPTPLTSELLEGQGLAVLRRDEGRAYIAVDYGHSGGGHGHPDRLNLQLAHGATRWLDDLGTGSYVDPSLHWYRSTLAHNAPLVDGHSQMRVDGLLRAYDERGDTGWVDVAVDGIAPGVRARRSIIVMPGYLVDVLEWKSDRDAQVDLPVHLDGETIGDATWRAESLSGGDGLEDGFAFLTGSAIADASAGAGLRLIAERDSVAVPAWIDASPNVEWWRATAPGAPGKAPGRFYLVRQRGRTGMVRSVFAWSPSVRDVRFRGDLVEIDGGDADAHVHSRHGDRWQIEMTSGTSTRSIELGGVRPASSRVRQPIPAVAKRLVHSIPSVADPVNTDRSMTFKLGEDHHRRSEESWREAGSPTVTVRLNATGPRLHVEIDVHKSGAPVFAPARERNDLDNERPDTNSDGIQLYLAPRDHGEAVASWLLVPNPHDHSVRTTSIGSAGAPRLVAHWAPMSGGYRVVCEIDLPAALVSDGFALDLIVNEISAERVRRRGQLVLSGAKGEWTYLRGDRHDRARFLDFVLASHAD
jgi:hypothetical protein